LESVREPFPRARCFDALVDGYVAAVRGVENRTERMALLTARLEIQVSNINGDRARVR
jgi:hypothetical protein